MDKPELREIVTVQKYWDCGIQGKGQTDFFEYKCFKNGNLHLKFKRQDLVDRLNYIAGERDQIGGE